VIEHQCECGRVSFCQPGKLRCPCGAVYMIGEEWTPDQPARGAGDVVAKITHKMGIKQCGGCKKRQAKLNELLPTNRKN